MKLAQEILQKYPESDFNKYECKFMIAFLAGMKGNPAEAINIYSKILEEKPAIKFAPRVLREIATCYERMNDLLSALVIYQRLFDDYPNSAEAREAKTRFNFILYGEPELKARYIAFKNEAIIKNGKVLIANKENHEILQLSAK